MAKSIDEINDDLTKFNEAYKESGWTDGKISLLTSAYFKRLENESRLTKEKLVEANSKFDNLMDVISFLKTSEITYKRLCKKYSIESKAKSRSNSFNAYRLGEKFYNSYDTIKIAAKELNISWTHLKMQADNRLKPRKKITSAKGYTAEYVKDRVVVYKLELNFLKKFNSLKEAELELGLKSSQILCCLQNKKKQVRGYFFENA